MFIIYNSGNQGIRMKLDEAILGIIGRDQPQVLQ